MALTFIDCCQNRLVIEVDRLVKTATGTLLHFLDLNGKLNDLTLFRLELSPNSDASSFRRVLWIPFLFLVLGCRAHDDIQRKSVHDLFGEALQSAASRPEVIQSPSSMPLRTMAPEFPIAPSNSILEESVEELPPEDSETTLPPIVSARFVRQSEERINEVFEQTDVREAIQILAGYGNQSVVIDETVGGVTSAQIRDDTFETALDKIMLPLGLVCAKHEGKYLIAPPDPDSPLFSYISERKQFFPKYHDIVSLVSLLPPRFKQFIQSSPERNMAIIDAPKTIANDLLLRLQEIDQPIPQVELEAIVCVVSPDSGFRFGLDWGHVVGIQGVDSLKAGMTGLSFSGQFSKQGANQAFSDFAVTSAFVRLLAQEGYVTIRAAPRVTARDGEKAKISIQRETFFSLQPTSSNVFFRQDVQKVDAGISLEIVPRIHGDIVNVLIEKAEVSEDLRASESRPELTSNPYPIINRRQVSTEVNVRDGHTIVIGGLVQRQTVDRVNRVPLLSRIPVAGNLFKTVEKQEQDAEVAIFISPRIVPAELCSDGW